jgi:pimeloyl-ACP methyl ester carboxylesterase
MFITINGCRLFFDTYGSKLHVGDGAVIEKPTLIVLHGGHGMVDHTLYVEFWSQFADLAQVIFLDQRGCGRSDHRFPEEWNLSYWAEDVYQFCQILGIKKPILAGISMGGHVMCEYVASHPEDIGGLIFCNTEAKFILDDVCAQLEKIGGREIADITRAQFTNPTAESARQYQEKCVRYYAKNAYSPQEINRCIQNTKVLSHFFKNHIHDFNYLADLEKIKCPTLFMVGAESPFHLPARAVEMAERIPIELVTLHLFVGAGAPVYKDSPEEAESVVRTYLNFFL